MKRKHFLKTLSFPILLVALQPTRPGDAGQLALGGVCDAGDPVPVLHQLAHCHHATALLAPRVVAGAGAPGVQLGAAEVRARCVRAGGSMADKVPMKMFMMGHDPYPKDGESCQHGRAGWSAGWSTTQ